MSNTGEASVNQAQSEGTAKKIGLLPLTALVISSSIGGGIFGIPSDLASGAAPGPALIAWTIVGFGVLMLSLCFNNLMKKRPDLDGIFSYAEEGFGKFGGFISGWGYWLSAWLGNVAFATMIMSAFGYFFPIFEGGQNIASIIVASIIMWGLTFIVNRGVESATILNLVITVCKLIPLFVFVIIGLFAFKMNIFTANFWGTVSSNIETGEVFNQVKNCMMVMMWVFVGIEGASILSSRAKKKSDAGKATVLGLLGLLVIYVFASIIPYGIMSQEEIASLQQPSIAYIFKEVVGPWGAAFINIGLIISLLGCWLSWTMLPGETTLLMSKKELLPKAFGRTNKANAPTFSLIVTAGLIQVFVFTFLFTDKAYNFAYSLCTASILICYVFVALYQVKLSYQNRAQKGEIGQLIIGICALIFQTWAILSSGLSYMLLCFTAYIPGIFFFIKARKEHGAAKALSQKEWLATIVIFIGAVIAVYLLATGKVQY
ncbi:arginine-ornithine antiporter [Bacillus rubiinfantis]|uniref:arginine-ornithine antiporter n=1 Tax=Bacillus rubiinfantis TaxID=1499680 RepID=UPI0005AA43A2|nr:arginine-ornithine antiporter [Bacillus rubiinfantis]